jgi:CDP-glucose 4,6-dehydratase
LAPEHKYGLFNLVAPVISCESVLEDIRNKERLQKEILSFQPDYIFHLAAQPLVRRSYKLPAETFEVNVGGTANVMESLIQLEKKCTIVVITTDKVYQNKEQDILYTEQDALGGYDPYSASKACTELVVSSFRNSFFNSNMHSVHRKAIATARAGNVIGGGDWNEDRIIPDIIHSLQQRKVLDVRNPHAVRPWQHVMEPISGYLLLGGLMDKSPMGYSPAYNFGPLPSDHLTVQKLVEKTIDCWGEGEWKDVSDRGQPHEAGLLKLDITLAKNELGWTPKLDAEQAIRWTVDWYKQPIVEQCKFTFHQIQEYLAL